MENTKVLNMRLPEKLFEDLKKAAKEMNISVAALVRIACTEYLKKEK